MATRRDPFDLRLSDAQTACLAKWVCDQVQMGIDARGSAERDVDYCHSLYEQARTRTQNRPWPDAADLTSYLGTEKVDALHARLVRTVWSEPVFTVEGWGESAAKAPFVEEFHSWKVEEERLQSVIDKLALISLIEPRGLLEVSEGTELRPSRERFRAKVQLDPVTGGIVYGGDDMSPQPELDANENLVEAGAQDIAAEMVVDRMKPVRTGPVYRILPYRDSLILPGHARDKADIWGYGKRFWRRADELKRHAAAGRYDEDAVDRMTTMQDREPDAALQRAKQDVAPQSDGVAEKELWEVLLLLDLNDLFDRYDLPHIKAAKHTSRWYLATVHLGSNQLLRFQFDDFERSRFVPVILFPRPDRATEGFSLIGHKLLTIIEEHTAVRNLRADRSSMANQTPIKRLQGALWDPLEQPFGPKAVIDVRDMNELQAFEVPDVTQALIDWELTCERTAERVVGVNDIASGQVSRQNRTLGEVQMATEQSFVRMDLITRRFQEAMEDIGQIRHAIWKRVLAERGEQGVDAPASMVSGLEGRGVSIDEYLPNGKVTAELLEGAFRFKPRGSVETADPAKLRNDLMTLIPIIQGLAQTRPELAMMLSRPTFGYALLRQVFRLFHFENLSSVLGSPGQDIATQLQLNQLPIPPVMPPPPPPMMGMGMPGMGPSGPPTGGMPPPRPSMPPAPMPGRAM